MKPLASCKTELITNSIWISFSVHIFLCSSSILEVFNDRRERLQPELRRLRSHPPAMDLSGSRACPVQPGCAREEVTPVQPGCAGEEVTAYQTSQHNSVSLNSNSLTP